MLPLGIIGGLGGATTYPMEMEMELEALYQFTGTHCHRADTFLAPWRCRFKSLRQVCLQIGNGLQPD